MKETFQLQPNKKEKSKPSIHKGLITKIWSTGTEDESVKENMREKIITQLEEEEKGSFKRGTNMFYNKIIGDTKSNQLTKQEWSVCRSIINKEIKAIEDNEQDILNIISEHEKEKTTEMKNKPFSDKSYVDDAQKMVDEEIRHKLGEDPKIQK